MRGSVSDNRNVLIDYLRCIGMLCIVLAHSFPPDSIFQLRNFDVPLLVVVSAMAYSMMPFHKIFPIGEFVTRRVIKLLVPTWLFFTFLFLLMEGATVILHKPYPFDTQDIVGTYTLYKGVGFVWILKVYLAMSLVTPLLFIYDRKMTDHVRYFSFIAAAYFLYEASYFLTARALEGSVVLDVLEKTVFLVFPFILIYAYGFRLERLSRATIVKILIACLLVWGGMTLYAYHETGRFVSTQAFKYPPLLYYVSYAMVWINGLYLVLQGVRFKGLFHSAAVWISMNSLWLYLWHILLLFVWQEALKSFSIPAAWMIKFVIVLCGAMIITAIQNAIIRPLLAKTSGNIRKWGQIAFG